MLIVDAHLDLAYIALRGRDVLQPVAQRPATAQGTPTVGLPDLYEGRVGLVVATIFCEPGTDHPTTDYQTPDEANRLGWNQMRWYHERRDEGIFQIVTGPEQIPHGREGKAQAVILLLEGADPVRSAGELSEWFDAGLRAVGLAWKRTRLAGGTGAPGPLTEEGIKLVRAMDRLKMIHDTSHLAEESFWQLMDLSNGPMMASHSNCRAIVPTDRQLSDAMIRALADRNGMIGINLYDRFLMPPQEYGKRRATLADVCRHVRHICDLVGDAAHVGLGTDMDGGFGREKIPQELSTSADLPRVADALNQAGFDDPAVRGFMGENWAGFFRRSLPG